MDGRMEKETNYGERMKYDKIRIQKTGSGGMARKLQ